MDSKEAISGGTVFRVKVPAGEKLEERCYSWEVQKGSDATKATAPPEVSESRGTEVGVH